MQPSISVEYARIAGAKNIVDFSSTFNDVCSKCADDKGLIV